LTETHISVRITGEKRLCKTSNEDLRNLFSPYNITSLAGIVGSNPARGLYVSHVSVVCCQVEVSVSGWSLVHRSPTECGVSECDHEPSTMRRPWPSRAVVPWLKNTILLGWSSKRV